MEERSFFPLLDLNMYIEILTLQLLVTLNHKPNTIIIMSLVRGLFCFVIVQIVGFQCFANSLNDQPLFFRHYTTASGLPSSYVKSIVQDSDGFIWATTRMGIARFDGVEFQEYPVFDDRNVRSKVLFNKLFLTKKTILVARTKDNEYYYYDRIKECFKPYPLLTKLGSVSSISSTNNGFWICKNGKIFFLDEQTGKSEAIIQKLKLNQIPPKTLFSQVIEKGEWLVFTTNSSKLYCYNKTQKQLREFGIPKVLDPDQYDLRLIDSHKNIWISSFDYGLACFNLEDGNFRFFSKDQIGNYHLPNNLVYSFSEDHLGRVWIGTESGLAIYEPDRNVLQQYRYKLADPNGLNNDQIIDVFCDKMGNMWLGTYLGGINFWCGEKQFFTTWSPGFGKWQIRGNIVSCLTEDSNKNLWIGLGSKGINKLNTKTGEITEFLLNDGSSRAYNYYVNDLIFVNDHELWIATYTGGLFLLDTQTNKYTVYNRKNTNNLLANEIYKFKQFGTDLYITTSDGIVIYSLTERKFRELKPKIIGSYLFLGICTYGKSIWFSTSSKLYRYVPENDSLFELNPGPEFKSINFVKTDSKGHIWVGDCYSGLCRYDARKKIFEKYNPSTGFPASWIFSLEEGMNGWFWISTDKGLVHFMPKTKEFTLYDNTFGTPFGQFNFRSSYTDFGGSLYFGSNNGMISFANGTPSLKSLGLPIVFTGFQLFNRPIKPGDVNNFDKSISTIDKIVLNHNQSNITIEYSALSFSSGLLCKYSYMLEGLDHDWNNVGNRNFATYPNLRPGTYLFRVKGSVNGTPGKASERCLTIVVLPPFWLTNWAYLIYAFLIGCTIVLIFRFGKNLEKARASASLEHSEKIHAEEIHKVKLDFFTNISHEIKTPLTLILGPLKLIMKDGSLSPELRKRLTMIERNTDRLYRLIVQLLEFRKIEEGKDTLKVSPCNIRKLMESISTSFDSLVESRDIDFKLHFPLNEQTVWIDVDKVDKVVFNLLTNAFKFTPDGGSINLFIQLVRRSTGNQSDLEDLLITVKDSGNGISPEMQGKIFNLFFQVDGGNVVNMGSGIGLAFVKSLVVSHKGSIVVDSTLNQGTSFIVKLPVSREDYTSDEIADESIQYERSYEFLSDKLLPEKKGKMDDLVMPSFKPHVLIVEDNVDLICFMKESLEMNYRITTAENGLDALHKLENCIPDLIITDIMMPKMDGIEFTNQLKNSIKLSHIPIILLTSKSGLDNKMEGLLSGADYYLEKPFYPAILEQNIENILNTRRRMIERFKSNVDVHIEELNCSSSDKLFIEKLTLLIKNRISDPDLDVTFLTKEMGVSRSLLHLKLKGLVDCSTTEYICAIRLKEAITLISSGKCNITQASYETGFASPNYFARRFLQFYGQSPREYFKL